MKTAMNEMLQWVRNTLPMDLDWPRMIEDKIESLLEKEKQQMLESSISGSKGNSFEQYYNQTYNK